MSLTTAFISELVRAANEAERLTPYAISRLLDRSVDAIRDMAIKRVHPATIASKSVTIGTCGANHLRRPIVGLIVVSQLRRHQRGQVGLHR